MSEQQQTGGKKKGPYKGRKKPQTQQAAGPRGRAQKGRNFRVSKVDPKDLVKAASIQEEREYISERTFQDMPISKILKQHIAKKGYERPTQIQDETLENLLAGDDLLGLAQTGSGKSMAFLIPIIQHIIESRQNPFALVVLPTRELAVQVEQEFRSITKEMKIFSACFIGGTNLNRDIAKCKRPSHVVIGTPGRIVDLVKRKCLNLNEFNTLVLDEFDRILDMGFIADIKKILGNMKHRKQTMLFSATIDDKLKPIIDDILTKPVFVQVTSGKESTDSVHQDVIKLKEGETKLEKLVGMLKTKEFEKVIIFDETKYQVKRLAQSLNKHGIQAQDIHGDKSQNSRQNALNQFKAGNVQVLVATDVAARGIDVNDITHVINYRLPGTMDAYIHRIGRTGRAGKVGYAYTFID